jgi:hypothetical protein
MKVAKGLTILVAASVAALTAAAMVEVPAATPAERVHEALDALHEGDLDEAERIAVALARADSAGEDQLWLLAATARERDGRLDQAVVAYRQSLATCDSPRRKRYLQASISRCRTAALPEPRPLSRQLTAADIARLSVVEDAENFHVESTEHFSVRACNAPLAKLVGEQAEQALKRICRVVLSGQSFPHSVQINVWPTLEEYRKHAVSSSEWSGGSFVLRHEADGRVVRRIDLSQLDRRGRLNLVLLDRALPHELCHLVLAEYFGDAACPTSLNEGLAMMAEATADNDRIALAGKALGGESRIALPDLLAMERPPEGNVAVFYAESFSFVSYLHERLTAGQFREMLAHVKDGLPIEEALQRALYAPLDETFMDRLTEAWEAEAIEQSQFLRALDADVAERAALP